MKAALALAAAALLLAIALAITAPASLLDGRLAEQSDGRLRIAEAAGTVWNGAGELVLLPRGTRRPLSWHIDAWPLFLGEVRGSVSIDGAAPPADFIYGRRDRVLRRFELSLPMDSVLESAGVPAALVGAGGSIAVHVERFVQTPDTIDADLALQWQGASLPALRPGVRIALGDVRLDLRGTGAEIGGALSNRGGDVEIAGRVAVSFRLVPRVDATIRPRAGIDRDRSEAIATALSLIGAPDGQGGYRVAWSAS